MQAFMSKHGGGTLKGDELKSIFTDFNPDGGDKADFLVNLHQFLVFFSKVARTMPNAQFNSLVSQLTK
jgi:hypothetical protein